MTWMSCKNHASQHYKEAASSSSDGIHHRVTFKVQVKRRLSLSYAAKQLVDLQPFDLSHLLTLLKPNGVLSQALLPAWNHNIKIAQSCLGGMDKRCSGLFV